MDDIIIEPHAGGLGDVLLYSHLPRLYSWKGHRVWWSSRTPFRSPEVEKLILSDPDIMGLTNREPNAGKKVFAGNEIIRAAKVYGNGVSATDVLHGFNHLPKRVPTVRYRPLTLNDHLAGANQVLIDQTSISQPISALAFNEFFDWVRRWHLPEDVEISVITSKYAGKSGSEWNPSIPTIFARNLEHYMDLVSSCGYFLCVESGSNMLASAIRGDKPTFCCMTTMSFNDRLFVQPNVTYYITGKMTPDYHHYS